MKHKFLLDENILHFAIKGINEHDQPDETSMELLRLIASNCHQIVLNMFLIDRYQRQLNKIRAPRRGVWATEKVSFINSYLRKAEKLSYESNDCPELPADIMVPTEDVEMVRIAVAVGVILITGDRELRDSVGANPQLGFKAIHPSEAIPLASET